MVLNILNTNQKYPEFAVLCLNSKRALTPFLKRRKYASLRIKPIIVPLIYGGTLDITQ